MTSRAFALLAWTALAVGSLAVVPLAKKLALNAGASAPAVAFLSVALSAVLVVGGLVVRGRANRLWTMGGRPRGAVLAVGALGSGLVPLLGLLAMTATTASNRALFQSAYPAATAVAAWLLLGERPGRTTLALIGGVCIGLALMHGDNLRSHEAFPSGVDCAGVVIARGGHAAAPWPFGDKERAFVSAAVEDVARETEVALGVPAKILDGLDATELAGHANALGVDRVITPDAPVGPNDDGRRRLAEGLCEAMAVIHADWLQIPTGLDAFARVRTAKKIALNEIAVQ